jgi:hypothetical protein
MRILFKHKTGFDSKGRNGFINTHGVEITRLGMSNEPEDTVWFEPITSRGAISEACRVVISFDAIDEVIESLQQLKKEKP